MTDVLTRTPARFDADVASAPGPDTPATALTGTVAEQLVVVVAPSTGRFRPDGDPAGQWLEPGTLIGHVTGGRGRADAVTTPVGARVADLLVRPGQLVYQGQGLAWLDRQPATVEPA